MISISIELLPLLSTLSIIQTSAATFRFACPNPPEELAHLPSFTPTLTLACGILREVMCPPEFEMRATTTMLSRTLIAVPPCIQTDLDLNYAHVLVTAASGGIGSAIAWLFPGNYLLHRRQLEGYVEPGC